MPEREHILIGLLILLMSAGAMGSMWAWLWTLMADRVPFWRAPREVPLPARTPMLFLAGGALLIVKTMLILSLGRPLMEQFGGPPPEDPAVFDSERVNLSTQINAGISIVVIVVAAVIVVVQSAERRRSLGFRAAQPGRQTWFGVQGFLLALIPVYLLVLVTLPWKQTEEAVHPLLRLVADGYIFWPLVTAVLIAPIQEELLYRVFLQEGLVAAGYPIRLALPAVAAFFCLNHLNIEQPSPDFIALIPLALLLGATLHYRCSFLACVVMHMLFNGFNIALTLLGGAS